MNLNIKATIFFFLIGMLPLLSHATEFTSGFLCVSDAMAGVITTESEVITPFASEITQRFIVDGSGFREFGRDGVLLNSCNWVNERPIICRAEDPAAWGGVFLLLKHNVFIYYGLGSPDDGEFSFGVTAGKCDRIG